MNKKIQKNIAEISGWVGAVLIHSATIPTSISVIFGMNPNLPELSLVLLVWSGLILFLVRAVFQKDMLYICLLYTSPSPRDRQKSRMPSSA